MKNALLALAGAAIVFTAAPADARRGHETIRVGYTFGPRYAYTDFGMLPQPMVRRYHLRHDFRYVYRDGFVYVVNPHTIAWCASCAADLPAALPTWAAGRTGGPLSFSRPRRG